MRSGGSVDGIGSDGLEKDEAAERRIELMLEDVERRPEHYTRWEKDFLESAEEQIGERHLSDLQVEKVGEVWREKFCQ